MSFMEFTCLYLLGTFIVLSIGAMAGLSEVTQ